MLPLAPEMVEGVRAEAAAFADELAALDVRSPAFTEKIEAITSMGAAEIRSNASVSNRMLDRLRRSRALRSIAAPRLRLKLRHTPEIVLGSGTSAASRLIARRRDHRRHMSLGVHRLSYARAAHPSTSWSARS